MLRVIDFLGIGAQKSGTTWLMKNLRSHPGVWTPRLIKELHYFDVLYLGYGRESQLNRIRRKMETLINKSDWDNALSDEKRPYFRRLYDPDIAFTDEWYEHIFSKKKNSVKGEFTPAYCAIGGRGVAHVRRLMPDVKLIYMVRDPYERAMSSLRMILERGNVRKRTPAELVEQPVFVKKGDYAANIPVWEEAFDPAQIFYIPFGRVKSDPNGVLRDVETYLGLEHYDKYPVVTKKVNATGKKKITIPPQVNERLRLMAEPQYSYLADRFGEAFLGSIR